MSSDYKKNKKKTVLVRKKLGGRSRKSGDLVQKVKKSLHEVGGPDGLVSKQTQ